MLNIFFDNAEVDAVASELDPRAFLISGDLGKRRREEARTQARKAIAAIDRYRRERAAEAREKMGIRMAR